MVDPPGRDEPLDPDDDAFWRHVRFGVLPPRVRPAELVETVDTDRVQRLDEPLDEWTWLRLTGGG